MGNDLIQAVIGFILLIFGVIMSIPLILNEMFNFLILTGIAIIGGVIYIGFAFQDISESVEVKKSE